MVKKKSVAEFGDFQTPLELAQLCCSVLERQRPATVIEPTCGRGTFLQAACTSFPDASHIIGVDINGRYVAEARRSLPSRVSLRTADFFSTDWPSILSAAPDPVLIIGNPPWVTSAELGLLNSKNLPQKSNFQNHSGLDAITGKSNFDISEWMLLRLFEWLKGRRATIGMLCKSAVARKVLYHCWNHDVHISESAVYKISASKYFGAAVDACFLVATLNAAQRTEDCVVFDSVTNPVPKSTFGFRDGRLLADARSYERLKHLEGEGIHRWRSGIKHDANKVMEFTKVGRFYSNGFGENVNLEETYLYPMLKASELANGHTSKPNRWMLVTQRSVGEDTAAIRGRAPRTWEYLQAHAEQLERRASSIYAKRPPFSVFGIGDYTFAPWKVAISGFYKRLEFTVLNPYRRKPVVLDDTSYFLPCKSKEEAEQLARVLNSPTAKDFYSAYIFWDAKRPITAATLGLLDIPKLAKELDQTFPSVLQRE